MMTDKTDSLVSGAVAWSLAYEQAAQREKRAMQNRKQAMLAASRPNSHPQGDKTESGQTDLGSQPEGWGEGTLLTFIKEAEAANHFLSLPFAAMADTHYGKKANYHRIVEEWNICDALDRGWALLALANTLEQVSEAIYEHHRALADLLRERLGQYGACKAGEMDKTDMALAAVAAMKAVRMEVLPLAEGVEARALFERYAGEPCVQALRPAADEVWGDICSLWGAEAAEPGGVCGGAQTQEEGRGSVALTLLHRTARSLVFELPGEDIYETEEYEIWVNGVFVRRDTRMVAVVGGLSPQTEQRVAVKKKDGARMELAAVTDYEYVTLNVRRFGAKGDGITDDTAAIQTAILSCPKHSRVYVPEGVYRIRNLFLKSDLVLELGKGAVLQGFQEREAFPVLPGRTETTDGKGEYLLGTWEGNPLPSMASILNAIHVEHVVICGEGVIDGGGDFEQWWVDGVNSYPPYRPKMMFFSHCRDITVEGIRVQNSPCWNLHPYFCQGVRVYGITLESPDRSHNTDGIDPESCTDVEIAGVHFSVGDDCIAIKSGKIYMGRNYQTPSKAIRIRQCLMEKGHGAVTIGSEISGGVLDVTVTKCLFRDTDRGLRIKTRRGRGKDSVVDGISFDTIRMEQVKAPFVVNCFYYCDPDGTSDYVAAQTPLPVDERTPVIRRLSFSHVECRDAHYAGICIYGLPEQKVEEVALNHVHIFFAPDAKEGIAAMMRECGPTSRRGIFVRNVRRVTMCDVHVEGAAQAPEWEGVEEMITG